MTDSMEEMAREFIRWLDAITSDDYRGDVDKVLFKQFFEQALRQVRERTIEEAVKVALAFTVCDFDHRLAPMQDEDMKLAYKIATAIRKLGEKNAED